MVSFFYFYFYFIVLFQKFNSYDITNQYTDYTAVVDSLLKNFEAAYESILSSQYSFNHFSSYYTSSLDSTQSYFILSLQNFSQAYLDLDVVSDDTKFRNDVFDILMGLNGTIHDIYSSFINNREVM